MTQTDSWNWNQWLFQSRSIRATLLPDPRVAQECAKYGMRAVFDLSRRTYLIGSEDTLYGAVEEKSLIKTELATTIAELFVTGPFRDIP